MDVRVVEDYTVLSQRAAEQVAALLREKPRAVIALPTGNTPVGFYRALVDLVRAGQVDMNQATLFNLDEYVGLPPHHPQSFHAYMQEHLLRHVQPGRWDIPDGTAPDPEAEARRYGAAIAAAGGFDLAVLGLGGNGHLAFNEPGTPPDAPTRVVELAPSTRAASAPLFGGLALVPERAITVGLKEILAARSVLLLVSGPGKAAIVRRALTGPVDPSVPASWLQRHPAVTALLDRAAAAQLA